MINRQARRAIVGALAGAGIIVPAKGKLWKPEAPSIIRAASLRDIDDKKAMMPGFCIPMVISAATSSSPTFVAVGAMAADEAAVFSGAAANDIGIIVVTANSSPTINIPSGWTAFSAQVANGSTASRVFWKRLAGGEGTVSVNITGATISGCIMFGVRGCVTAGDPFEDYQSEVGTSTSMTCDTITTTGADRLAVRIGGTQDFIANLGSAPSGYAEAFEVTDEPCFCMDYKAVASATTEAATTRTLGSSLAWFTHTMAMRPA